MRVAVVAEFYPRRDDPVLGVWAHRQAIAARDAGADVSVFVLQRLVPPRRRLAQIVPLVRHPGQLRLDGIDVHYVRYVSPPRERGYAGWGAWASPMIGRALRREAPFEVIHAHNAVPAGDAVQRAKLDVPLVVSVHGGDVLWTSSRVRAGREAVARVLGGARLTLANSDGIRRLAIDHGARDVRVVHLGTDLPETAVPSESPLIATVGHLVARKRHADVLAALAHLPGVRYLVIGDGPQRGPLERLAATLGLANRVEFTGQLDPDAALARARTAWCLVMPSTKEAFGVAYIEAMAAGVPAIGCVGEPGPEEIARAGGGIELVPAEDPAALAACLRRILEDRGARLALGAAARATVEREFTWRHCGEQTLAAYREALG
jgi:teichuronic acid biosynthesis glycosyltransferase TuaC